MRTTIICAILCFRCFICMILLPSGIINDDNGDGVVMEKACVGWGGAGTITQGCGWDGVAASFP